jgi:hypothetical protein
MASHKKKKAPKNCRICGQLFKSSYAFQDVCPKCESTLPKCDSCHTVMAKEYGYMEGFARKVGKYEICDWCDMELKNKRCLHISEDELLLSSGRVKVIEG